MLRIKKKKDQYELFDNNNTIVMHGVALEKMIAMRDGDEIEVIMDMVRQRC